MNELININYDDEIPKVNGRELHEKLHVKTNYTDWFKRMCDFGFKEDTDYYVCFPNLRSDSRGGQNKIDHYMTIDMAKQICMIQRSKIGTQFRQYFIQIEKDWNSPEKVMARALILANKKINLLEHELKGSKQLIQDLKPKANYYDVILNCNDLIPTTLIAKDYGMSAKAFNKLLHEFGIQFFLGDRWYLYNEYAPCGYAQSKTCYFKHNDGSTHTKNGMYWTQKGRIFLYYFLKNKNIFPIVERVD